VGLPYVSGCGLAFGGRFLAGLRFPVLASSSVAAVSMAGFGFLSARGVWPAGLRRPQEAKKKQKKTAPAGKKTPQKAKIKRPESTKKTPKNAKKNAKKTQTK